MNKILMSALVICGLTFGMMAEPTLAASTATPVAHHLKAGKHQGRKHKGGKKHHKKAKAAKKAARKHKNG